MLKIETKMFESFLKRVDPKDLVSQQTGSCEELIEIMKNILIRSFSGQQYSSPDNTKVELNMVFVETGLLHCFS